MLFITSTFTFANDALLRVPIKVEHGRLNHQSHVVPTGKEIIRTQHKQQPSFKKDTRVNVD